MDILEYLQSAGTHGRNHSLDFIMALYAIYLERKGYPDIDKVIISNKDVFDWIKMHGGSISNITLQCRKAEIVKMGLAVKSHRKRGAGDDLILTKKGIKIAEITKNFINDVAQAFIEDKQNVR